MSKSSDLLEISDEESLVFSIEQIQYLREEFERQRKWVNLLSNREQTVLKELEDTKNSVSYKIGRILTWAPRIIIKKRNQNSMKKISTFIQEDEEEKEEDLFPSSLVISPELLPTNSEMMD